MKSWKMAIFPVMKTLVVPLMTNPFKLNQRLSKRVSVCIWVKYLVERLPQS